MASRYLKLLRIFYTAVFVSSNGLFADLDDKELLPPKPSDFKEPQSKGEDAQNSGPDLGRRAPLKKSENNKPTKSEDTKTPKDPPPPTKSTATRKPGISESRPDYSKEPVDWSASKVSGSLDNKVFELHDEVKVKQADVLLTADKAVLYLNKDETVDKIVATGNVKMVKAASSTSSEVIARGQEATFYNLEQKVSLSGRASLIRNGDVVRGKTINYELKTGLITVENVEGQMKKPEKEKSR